MATANRIGIEIIHRGAGLSSRSTGRHHPSRVVRTATATVRIAIGTTTAFTMLSVDAARSS
jgi:hypothetical protein